MSVTKTDYETISTPFGTVLIQPRDEVTLDEFGRLAKVERTTVIEGEENTLTLALTLSGGEPGITIVIAGLQVTVTAVNMETPITWDWGDGLPDTVGDETAVHTYLSGATYTITATDSQSVEVSEPVTVA